MCDCEKQSMKSIHVFYFFSLQFVDLLGALKVDSESDIFRLVKRDVGMCDCDGQSVTEGRVVKA